MRAGYIPPTSIEQGVGESTYNPKPGNFAAPYAAVNGVYKPSPMVDQRKLSKEYVRRRGLNKLSFAEKCAIVEKYRLLDDFDAFLKAKLKVRDKPREKKKVPKKEKKVVKPPPAVVKAKTSTVDDLINLDFNDPDDDDILDRSDARHNLSLYEDDDLDDEVDEEEEEEEEEEDDDDYE